MSSDENPERASLGTELCLAQLSDTSPTVDLTGTCYSREERNENTPNTMTNQHSASGSKGITDYEDNPYSVMEFYGVKKEDGSFRMGNTCSRNGLNGVKRDEPTRMGNACSRVGLHGVKEKDELIRVGNTCSKVDLHRVKQEDEPNEVDSSCSSLGSASVHPISTLNPSNLYKAPVRESTAETLHDEYFSPLKPREDRKRLVDHAHSKKHMRKRRQEEDYHKYGEENTQHIKRARYVDGPIRCKGTSTYCKHVVEEANVDGYPSKFVNEKVPSNLPKENVNKIKRNNGPAGVIFMCNRRTWSPCFQNRLFGLPPTQSKLVKRIVPGTKLFLFVVDSKELHGVFEATSHGGYNINPNAFGSGFPSQVEFHTLKKCKPLAEKNFKPAIESNYFAWNKFKHELSLQQVSDLLQLFCPNENLLRNNEKMLLFEARKSEQSMNTCQHQSSPNVEGGDDNYAGGSLHTPKNTTSFTADCSYHISVNCRHVISEPAEKSYHEPSSSLQPCDGLRAEGSKRVGHMPEGKHYTLDPQENQDHMQDDGVGASSDHPVHKSKSTNHYEGACQDYVNKSYLHIQGDQVHMQEDEVGTSSDHLVHESESSNNHKRGCEDLENKSHPHIQGDQDHIQEDQVSASNDHPSHESKSSNHQNRECKDHLNMSYCHIQKDHDHMQEDKVGVSSDHQVHEPKSSNSQKKAREDHGNKSCPHIQGEHCHMQEDEVAASNNHLVHESKSGNHHERACKDRVNKSNLHMQGDMDHIHEDEVGSLSYPPVHESISRNHHKRACEDHLNNSYPHIQGDQGHMQEDEVGVSSDHHVHESKSSNHHKKACKDHVSKSYAHILEDQDHIAQEDRVVATSDHQVHESNLSSNHHKKRKCEDNVNNSHSNKKLSYGKGTSHGRSERYDKKTGYSPIRTDPKIFHWASGYCPSISQFAYRTQPKYYSP